jgi:hypothetical protein
MQTSQSLRNLFEAAIELEPAARAAFLDLRCTDTSLRARVERLLLADADADAAALFSGGARAAAVAIGDAGLPMYFRPAAASGRSAACRAWRGRFVDGAARREVQVQQDVALKVLRRGLYCRTRSASSGASAWPQSNCSIPALRARSGRLPTTA